MENNNNEKTFTQEQLNAIVGKRLAEQKQQQETELTEKLQELKKREMTIRAREMLSERKMPDALANILKYDNEEELEKALDSLEKLRGFESRNNKPEEDEFEILGDNRLPFGTHEKPDPLPEAFGLKGK